LPNVADREREIDFEPVLHLKLDTSAHLPPEPGSFDGNFVSANPERSRNV
jgi:hypothetical protein